MHEYSIAKGLIDSLTEQVESKQLANTEIVHLQIGELKIISREALSQAFKIITEETVLEGADLEFEEIPVSASCKECDYEGQPEYRKDPAFHYSVPILSCPECGGSLEIKKGTELCINKLTVSDPNPNE